MAAAVAQRLRLELRALEAAEALAQAAWIYFCAQPIYQAALQSRLEAVEPQALVRHLLAQALQEEQEDFHHLEAMSALNAEAAGLGAKLTHKAAAAVVDNLAATTVAQRLTVGLGKAEGTPIAAELVADRVAA